MRAADDAMGQPAASLAVITGGGRGSVAGAMVTGAGHGAERRTTNASVAARLAIAARTRSELDITNGVSGTLAPTLHVPAWKR